MQTPYYIDTLTALKRGNYISPQAMLYKFESYPFFDTQHARDEILRAVNDYKLNGE